MTYYTSENIASKKLIFHVLLYASSLREKCQNTEFSITLQISAFSPNTGKYGPEENSLSGHFSHSAFSLKQTSFLNLTLPFDYWYSTDFETHPVPLQLPYKNQ